MCMIVLNSCVRTDTFQKVPDGAKKEVLTLVNCSDLLFVVVRVFSKIAYSQLRFCAHSYE